MSAWRYGRVWGVVSFAAIGLLSAALLPARDHLPFSEPPPRLQPSALQMEENRLRGEASRLRNELEYLAIMDSIAATLPDRQEAIVGAWWGNQDVTDGEIQELVRTELAAWGVDRPPVRVGTFSASMRRERGHAPTPGADRARLFIHQGSEPFCFMVGPAMAGVEWSGITPQHRGDDGTALAGCLLFARFGVPGERVMAWLLAGGFELTWMPGGWPESRSVRDLDEIEAARYLPRTAIRREACASGRIDLCEAMFLSPLDQAGASELPPYVPGVEVYRVPGYVGSYSGVGKRGMAIFADLEAEFGPAALEGFWRSPSAVPSAFEEAFGVPLADWMYHWTRQNFGVSRPGPVPPPGSAALAALWIGLFGVTTTALARRRGRRQA